MPIKMTLKADYRTAAEGLQKLLQNSTLTEDKHVLADDREQDRIILEGDFAHFDLYDMETWGGHLRFEIFNTESTDEEEIAVRGHIAMYVPELASIMTARALMTVSRRVEVTIRTQRIIRGRVVDSSDEVREEWEDITKEFHDKAANNFGWHKGRE